MLRPKATAQTPQVIELAADLTHDPRLNKLHQAVQQLMEILASPTIENLTDKDFFRLTTEVDFQLANPEVEALLGPYAVTLSEDLEELDRLYEEFGWTPTVAMKAVELKMEWVRAIHRSL